MDPKELEKFLGAFLPREHPKRPTDTTIFADALRALPPSAALALRKPTTPDMWRATLGVLDEHPLPGLLALLLTSYKLNAQRPDAEARETLAALIAKHPELSEAMKMHGSGTKVAKLTFKALPSPARSRLTPLQRKQLAWFDREGGDYEALAFFEIFDGKGTHKYDATILAGDDGKVFQAGTNKAVAMFAQGGAEAKSDALSAALEQGLADYERARKRGA